MSKEVNASEAACLEQRIQRWIEDNPDRAHAGERMLGQLTRIRTEFTGETARRLEALVDETLTRQLHIDESRRAGLEAAKRLTQTVQQLSDTMLECLVSAKSAHEAAARSVVSAMSSRAQAKAWSNPRSFQSSSDAKKRMN